MRPMENDELEVANHKAKESEILDSWVLVEHMWGTFDILVFKVILASFGACSLCERFSNGQSQGEADWNFWLEGTSAT